MSIYNLVATEVLTEPSMDADGNPTTVTYQVGDVVQQIVWDGVSEYTPPPGTKAELASPLT